jgi:hypothetical protein
MHRNTLALALVAGLGCLGLIAAADFGSPVADDASSPLALGTPTGKIGDFVWNDANGDGLQAAGEVGLANVTVRLEDTGGNLLAQTVTNLSGKYLFVGIAAGTYVVRVDESTIPSGLVQSPSNVGSDDTIDSDGSPFTYVAPDDVHVVLRIDFGFTADQGGGGDEGCTPGYWKQSQHFDSWPAPYTTTTLFGSVFEDAFPGLTLLNVVANPGGSKLKQLGVHTVAALLNSASSGVDYELTTAEVIQMFNDTFPGTDADYEALKDVFEAFNELSCPLN